MDARLLLHIYCVLLFTLSIGCAKEIIASEIASNDNVRCIPKEREALLKFKNALERSERLGSWGNDNECCEWMGVLCSNTTGHVTRLDLSSNSLSGAISEIHFKNLSNLEYLSLSSNNLTIHLSLGNMPSLNFLNLSNNQLEGEISSIFGWTNSSTVGSSLEYLILGSNQLRGNLPESIGLLHKLKYLDLSSNSLHGVISEIHFKNLSNLKYLSLSSNNLTVRFSPNWIPPFQLDSIYLGSCNLGPQFPDWLKTQTGFYVLDISFSQISDAIPNWFWSLSSSARLLNISNNAMHGAVPTFSSQITDLSSNQFEGPLPLIPLMPSS